MHVITSKTFSIYFLLKVKNGLANLRKPKNIKQEKNHHEETIRNLNIITFLEKFVILKLISSKIVIYGEAPFNQ